MPPCTNSKVEVVTKLDDPSKADKHEARKLSQLHEPERTRLWLDMCFKRDPESKLELLTLWDSYSAIFEAFDREAPHLDTAEWLAYIQHALPYAREGTTEGGVDYVGGIALREQVKPYRQIMAEREDRRRRRTERRLRVVETAGDLPPPTNAFQQHLRQDPLLPLSDRRLGPVTSRLIVRAEGKPLGDTVPGFESVSMKKVSKEYKHSLREGRRSSDETTVKPASSAGRGSSASS